MLNHRIYKFICCVVALLGVTTQHHLNAQKALKPIRIYLQQNKPAQALAEIQRLSTDEKTAVLPKLYDYGVEANIQLYNSYNEKMYLKQASDTAAFFKATYDIFVFALKCDSLEQINIDNGQKAQFRKKNNLLLHEYYSNLRAGSWYFFRHKDYKTAACFALLVHNAPFAPLWGENQEEVQTQTYNGNASIGVLSLYQLSRYDEIGPLVESALSDTGRLRESVVQALALVAESKSDSAQTLQYLQLGLQDHPNSPFFFDKLANYYQQKQDYVALRTLAEDMLQRDSLDARFLATETFALICLDENERAIEFGKELLRVDSANVMGPYYLGVAYCNMASKIELPTNINNRRYKTLKAQKQNFYRAARPYLEAYKELRPKDSSDWAPLLYRVYLELNEGRKFEEMARILSSPTTP